MRLKLLRVIQVASRAVEGLTIVGATDFLASEPGRTSAFVNPEDTKGLTGRKKAAAEFRNRIKYGGPGVVIVKELNKASGVWSMQSQMAAIQSGTWVLPVVEYTGINFLVVAGGGGTDPTCVQAYIKDNRITP